MYLTSNLPGLLNELAKYASNEEILNFINELDLVSRGARYGVILKNNKIQNAIKAVNDFLIKAYMSKLNQQLSNGEITQEEFEQKAAKFLQSFGSKIRVGYHHYDYSVEEAMQGQIRTEENERKKR